MNTELETGPHSTLEGGREGRRIHVSEASETISNETQSFLSDCLPPSTHVHPSILLMCSVLGGPDNCTSHDTRPDRFTS